MVKIPNIDENVYGTAYLLNHSLVEDEKRSQRLGMGSLGEKCTRKLWLKFRWARITSISRKISRLFDLGNSIEDRAIKDLEEIGITVTDKQKGLSGWGGHIYGKIDGIAHGVKEAPKTPHLLEVKSHNDRNYNNIVKKGIKEGKIEHYVQMMMYMGKEKLIRGLYLAINKNNSEAHIERIYYDEDDYREYMTRGMDVISHEVSPPNLFGDRNNQVCRFCDFVPICYDNDPYLKSCRTCTRCDIEDDGKWKCSLLNKQLTYEDQVNACDHYRQIR